MVGGAGVVSKVVAFGELELSLSCKNMESMRSNSELSSLLTMKTFRVGVSIADEGLL